MGGGTGGAPQGTEGRAFVKPWNLEGRGAGLGGKAFSEGSPEAEVFDRVGFNVSVAADSSLRLELVVVISGILESKLAVLPLC